MVRLEGKFRQQLLLLDALLFRCSTVRLQIQYQVINSQDRTPSTVRLEIVRQIGPLPSGKRGVIYVRTYSTGNVVQDKLQCPFYKAHLDQKSKILADWI